jgi:hypothetical protein
MLLSFNILSAVDQGLAQLGQSGNVSRRNVRRCFLCPANLEESGVEETLDSFISTGCTKKPTSLATFSGQSVWWVVSVGCTDRDNLQRMMERKHASRKPYLFFAIPSFRYPMSFDSFHRASVLPLRQHDFRFSPPNRQSPIAI